MKAVLVTVTLFVLSIPAVAQSGGSFTITKSVIAGGGGRAAGGTFIVNGTIGQPLAGGPSNGGTFSVTSGFWGGESAGLEAPFDFDGDGKTDVAIFRPSNGQWWYKSSIDGSQNAATFGMSGDIPRPSDFDGDGKADFVLFRPSSSTWLWPAAFAASSAPCSDGFRAASTPMPSSR